jgi:hypothetical protein
MDIAVVIAAAIHASLGHGTRVVSITPVGGDRGAWSLEGRRTILHSHKVR